MSRSGTRIALLVLLGMSCLGRIISSQAQEPLSQVGLIGSSSVASASVPTAQTFTIGQAGSYTITLTDLQTPATLTSLMLAVAGPSTLAAQLSAAGATDSQSVTLQPGTYTEQVLAVAGTLGGSFSVEVKAANGTAVPVTPVGGTTSANAFVGAVAASSGTVAGESVLQTSFAIGNAGPYQLTVTDLAFPAALAPNTFFIAVWNQANPSVLLLRELDASAGSFALGSLAAGTYQLIVVAQAASPGLAGLFSVEISGGSPTNVVLASIVPVGNLPAPLQFTIPSAESLSLTLADLATPATLASLKGMLVEGGTVLQPSVGSGTYTIPGAAVGTAELFISAQAAGATGEGTVAAVVRGGSQTLMDVAQPVTDSSHDGYAFATSLSTAGSYELEVNDFKIPAALSSLSALVEQGGALLATTTLAAGGTATLAPQPQAGAVNIVAFAAPASGGGLFGVQLSVSSSNSAAYQSTQGVGPSFHAQTVTVPTAGSYDVTLTDLGFPASFSELSLFITNGTQMLGQIDGSGSFSLNATPGTYVFNILAQPGTANYGLYGVQMSAAPASTTTTSTSSTAASSGGGGALSPAMLLLLALASLWRRRASPSA